MTIFPAFWRRIAGSTAWTVRTTPKKLVSNCSLACSSVTLLDGACHQVARVVHEHVEPAGPLLDRLNARAHGLGRSNVEREQLDAAGCPAGGAAARPEHLVPVSREPLGDRGPESLTKPPVTRMTCFSCDIVDLLRVCAFVDESREEGARYSA